MKEERTELRDLGSRGSWVIGNSVTTRGPIPYPPNAPGQEDSQFIQLWVLGPHTHRFKSQLHCSLTSQWIYEIFLYHLYNFSANIKLFWSKTFILNVVPRVQKAGPGWGYGWIHLWMPWSCAYPAGPALGIFFIGLPSTSIISLEKMSGQSTTCDSEQEFLVF